MKLPTQEQEEEIHSGFFFPAASSSLPTALFLRLSSGTFSYFRLRAQNVERESLLASGAETEGHWPQEDPRIYRAASPESVPRAPLAIPGLHPTPRLCTAVLAGFPHLCYLSPNHPADGLAAGPVSPPALTPSFSWAC